MGLGPVTEALCLLALVAGGAVLGRYLRWAWRAARLSASLPGPPFFPVIGSFLSVAGSQDGLFARCRRLQQRYGRTLRFWLGPVLLVFLSEPRDVQVVLTHPRLQSKPLLYRAARPVLGLGLITLSGRDHRRHRKAISPSLHLHILRDFVPIFVCNSVLLCRRLDPFAASGEVLDLGPHLGWYNAQAVCETLLSTSYPDTGLQAEKDCFVTFVDKAFKLTLYLALRPWLLWEPLFALVSRGKYREYKRVVSSLDSFVSRVLSYKLAHPLALPPRRRRAFLDHVLESPEAAALTDTELVEELKTLMVTATDTTMELMSFFLVTMAILPDVQDKVYQELEDTLGDREPSFSDLQHLEYLERVLKEVLRMFPVVPMFARSAESDVTLPSGHVLPRGCTVLLAPFFLHRDPRNFANPKEFDPDRFLPSNTRARHPFAYIPFSAGARNCIGQRYLFTSAKALSASLLRAYRFLPDPLGPQRLQDIKLGIGASLSIAGGARLRISRRQPQS